MNSTLPNYDEKSTSQFSAVKQLINMGYNYLSRAEVRQILQKQDYKNLLEEITFQAMRKINDDTVSDKSIQNRIYEIQKTNIDSSDSSSLNIYKAIMTGESVNEYVNGKKTEGHIKIIDWDNVENNIFHVTTEYNIIDKKHIRIDIVVFINGIPCAIIENKKPSVAIDEAVNQIIRNSTGNDAPYFFLFPQIYIAANITNLKYGTYKTPHAYYNFWKEKYKSDDYNNKLMQTINTEIEDITLNKILHDLSIQKYKHIIKDEPSEQDIGIYGLLQKERIIDIIRNFILYDKGIKKIARYNQYFAVKEAFADLNTFNDKGIRNGGLIWHTQGSGKSLTMVLLAKLILKSISLARIFIVTDRIDLDEQIRNTFNNNNITDKEITKVSSGKYLIKRLKAKEYGTITTTLIHKFNITDTIDDDNNIFIFVDEAHRTQDGITNATMQAVMPKACIIGFTGTPLMTKTKSRTIEKFNNNLIDTYKMKDAEIDEAVCQLVYQGRFAEQKLNKIMADFKFDNITKLLNDKQKQDLIKKYVSSTLMKENSKYIYVVGTDIYNHFITYFKGTGLKGQIVAPSKYAAVCFHKWFQEYNQFVEVDKKLNTAVVISDDNKYDNTGSTDDEDDDYNNVVSKFLSNIKKTTSLKHYEENIINTFKTKTDEVELLIVVNKLLTGFDAPRNTVLYLVKQLENHNLMQAIARVNRVFDGDDNRQPKTNGLIIDYSANAQNLKDAMQLFSGFNPDDVEDMLKNTDDLIAELLNIFDQMNKIFKKIGSNSPIEKYVEFFKKDNNSFERELFYNNVNKCINLFNSCLTLPDFHTKISINDLNQYKDKLKSYVEIKKATKLAMAEIIDFSKYKNQLKKILDEHLSADEVTVLTKEINISNSKEFNSFIEDNNTGLSKKSQADAIAAQTKKIIKERYYQDETFYQKFSDIIDDIIKRLKLIKEEDIDALLQEVKHVQEQVSNYKDNSEKLPENIMNNKATHPYFRKLKAVLNNKNQEETAEITLYIYNLIEKNKKVDFYKNTTIKNKVIDMIQDYFIDELGLNNTMSYAEINKLAEDMWNTAVANK